MSNLKDPNTKFHFNDISWAEFTSSLTSINSKCPFLLWQKNLEAQAENFLFSKIRSENEVLLEHNEGALKKLVFSKLTNKQVLFKISFPKSYFFGQGKLSSSAEGNYLLSDISQIFESRQREDYRFDLTLKDQQHIFILYQNYRFMISDISGGGVKILIPLTLGLPTPKKEDSFGPFSLVFERQEFFIGQATIVKHEPLPSKNCAFWSLQFTNFSDQEKQNLVLLIYSKARERAYLKELKQKS